MVSPSDPKPKEPKHPFIRFLQTVVGSRVLWILAIAFAILWFGHGPALTWVIKSGLRMMEPSTGAIITTGHLNFRFNGPVEIDQLRVRLLLPEGSQTDFSIKSVRWHWNGIFTWFQSRGRIIESLDIDGVSGLIDAHPGETPPPIRLPVLQPEQKEQAASWLLKFLPERIRLSGATLKILAGAVDIQIDGLDFVLDETSQGELSLKRLALESPEFSIQTNALYGVTAWRNGRATLVDAALNDEIFLRNLTANFVKPGGIGLAGELELLGGKLRADLDVGERHGLIHLDGTVSATNLDLAVLPSWLGWTDTTATGNVRDARLTFRGNPDFPLDAEVALRLSAGNVQWNNRGWESLEIGATVIGRRFYLSNFHLSQESNQITANGEAAIPNDFDQLPQTRFFVNLSADVRDVTALANLVGPELNEFHGQLSLHGSVNGNDGEFDGYLNASANDLVFSGLPPSSAKLSVLIKTTEIQVRHMEVWSGEDRIDAKASVSLHSPHAYSGELDLRIADVGLYAPIFAAADQPQVLAGGVDVQWKGDGTVTAHSGAFKLQINDVVTDVTPSGITGSITGTYSPENIYLGDVRLSHENLALKSRLTLAASGVNLSDLTILRSTKPILTGEAFIPIDVFAVAMGTPVADAIDLKRPVHAQFGSGLLAVGDLLEMAGQKSQASGTVSLDLQASGVLPELQITGDFKGSDLTATFDDFQFPSTSVSASIRTEEKNLVTSGRIDITGFDAITLDAALPFTFERLDDGAIRWFRQKDPVRASFRFPDTNMEIIRPLLPQAKRLAGTLRGSIDITGTLAAPETNGEITLHGGAIEFAQNLPVLNGLEAKIRFDTDKMLIDSIRGDVGAGPFEISGNVNYADVGNPAIDVSLTGDNVLIYRDPGVRLRADIDLRVVGTVNDGGEISGDVKLEDGRIFRRLEITPFLVQTRVDGGGIEIPVVSGLVPPPFDNWKVNVRIRNGTPFLIVGNIATGALSPDLTVSGSLGDPTMSGVIAIQNLQAYLPASDLIVPDGKISFNAANPFMPVLDIRGFAEVSGIRVQAFAYGPLSQANFALRSDPPLSQENLILLVTTGVAPVGMSGADLGAVAVGQGSILLLRSLARQLEPFGIQVGALVNRVGVGVVPPPDNTQNASVVAELRLTDQFSLISGTDGFGFFNAGVQYTIRFR